jgi:hypothetical protein
MEREAGGVGGEWRQLSENVLRGMQDWRAQHPRATLQEIEREVDRRLAENRAQLLAHLAEQSPAAAWSGQPAGTEPAAEPPRCPHCGTALEGRGRKTRRLKTQGGRELTLERE